MRKKVVLLLFLIVFIGSMAVSTLAGCDNAHTHSPSDQNLIFTLSDDEQSYSAEIRDNTYSGSLEIPANYNGKPVTGIGDNAFYECSSVTSITLPNSITSIGYYAFWDCGSLANVYYEGRIEDWCNISFSDFTSNPMSYASHFYMKDSNSEWEEVVNIAIPDTITEIGAYQFYGFNNVMSVTIPSSVTSIGGAAFYECSSVTSIGVPNSVTNIGEYAFYKCSNLTSVTIGDSVMGIGQYAFLFCYRLVEIYDSTNLIITKGSLDNGHIGYYAKVIHKSLEESNLIETEDGYVFIKDENNKYYLVKYVGTDTELTLPENIEGNTYEVNPYAFYECSSLISITIPNGVTSIGDFTFSDCSGLTSITFDGIIEEWNAIKKGIKWNSSSSIIAIVCTDGTITL